MDKTKIERVIIQYEVPDRMPPSILDKMLKWDVESMNLSRCFIACDELEMAYEIQRTHDLGMLPIVIVEDRRERSWHQWQLDYELPAFIIGFYLQDEARCQRLINAPSIQFFNHLKSLLVGKKTMKNERDNDLINVEKALGESLVGWLSSKENLRRQLFSEISQVTIPESQMLAPDKYGNQYWNAFAGCWFDPNQKPGGLFSTLYDIGITVAISSAPPCFETDDENGITNWRKDFFNALNKYNPLNGLDIPQYAFANLGPEDKQPVFCVPIINQDGACPGLFLLGIPSKLNIEYVELNNESIDIGEIKNLSLQETLQEMIESSITRKETVHSCFFPKGFKLPANSLKISAYYMTDENDTCLVYIEIPASDT